MESAKLFADRRFYWALCYFLPAFGLLIIGNDYFSDFSTPSYIFWVIIGIWTLPWSVIAGGIAIAFLHTGTCCFLAKMILAIGAIVNFLFILFWRRTRSNSSKT